MELTRAKGTFYLHTENKFYFEFVTFFCAANQDIDAINRNIATATGYENAFRKTAEEFANEMRPWSVELTAKIHYYQKQSEFFRNIKNDYMEFKKKAVACKRNDRE